MGLPDIQIPIKVLVHKQDSRVLFAEANSDFVEILFSFLTLPMGTIVRLLSNHPNSSSPHVIGSFNNLYTSLANLDVKYFATRECKNMLLNTRNSVENVCQNLKIKIDGIKRVEYFICENVNCSRYLSFYKNVKCKYCSKLLNRQVYYSWLDPASRNRIFGEGAFVSKTASFVITDVLRVISNQPASTFAILENSGFTDFEEFEEKTFNVGLSEILDLLKYSFMSNKPLSALFSGKNYLRMEKSIQTINLALSADGIHGFNKMSVKVIVQKSSNMILFALGSKDFVEFLFHLLTVPVGRVISLLREYYTPALCLQNIYQSVSDLNVGECFKSKDTKEMLLCPQLAILNGYSNQLFPHRKERSQKFHLQQKHNPAGQPYEFPYPFLTKDSASATHELKLASLFCDEMLAGSPMFMVTDDLVISPFSSMSCIKYLQGKNISPGDTEERVIGIGMKEAVNLLRASLVSTSVLRNGLKHLLLRKPKTERLMKKPKVEK